MIFETYIQSYVFAFNGLEREIWNYQDGCVLTAMQELYEVEENPLYYQSISAFMDQFIGEDGCIRSYNAKDYNLDKIPPGRVLFFLYGHTKEIPVCDRKFDGAIAKPAENKLRKLLA